MFLNRRRSTDLWTLGKIVLNCLLLTRKRLIDYASFFYRSSFFITFPSEWLASQEMLKLATNIRSFFHQMNWKERRTFSIPSIPTNWLQENTFWQNQPLFGGGIQVRLPKKVFWQQFSGQLRGLPDMTSILSDSMMGKSKTISTSATSDSADQNYLIG